MRVPSQTSFDRKPPFGEVTEEMNMMGMCLNYAPFSFPENHTTLSSFNWWPFCDVTVHITVLSWQSSNFQHFDASWGKGLSWKCKSCVLGESQLPLPFDHLLYFALISLGGQDVHWEGVNSPHQLLFLLRGHILTVLSPANTWFALHLKGSNRHGVH